MPKVSLGYDSPAPATPEPHTEDMSGPTLNNNTVLKELQRRLGCRGIEVSVQPSITTSSVYVTFDHGILKKARIGDHRGKGYNYSFEIGAHILTYREVPEEFNGRPYTRKRYPANEVGHMVQDILTLRASLISRYTQEGYDKLLARKKEQA